MLLLCLKIVSLSLQLAVTAQVLEHLRLPFEFRRWRYAWRAMLVASLLMTSKRIYDFWDVVPFATIGMNMTTDLVFLYALWNLRVIFMRELGAPLLDPVAHVTIDQHSQIVAWDATATRLFGWDATDAIGRTLMQTIMCSRDWEAHRAGMARYLASGDERADCCVVPMQRWRSARMASKYPSR